MISATFILMHPLRKQPLLEFLILLAGMISIMLLIQGTNTWIALTTTKLTMPIAKKEASDLRLVQATSCPTGLGSVDRPGLAQSDLFNDFTSIFNAAVATTIQPVQDIIHQSDIDGSHPQLNTLIDSSKIEITKVMNLNNSHKNLEPGRIQQNEIIGIKTSPGQAVKVPKVHSKRLLNGTNLVGMVMSATGDSIRFAFGRTDKPNAAEGYNLYIKGINISQSVLSKYAKGGELGRSCMPEMSIGDILGTAAGSEIYLMLRDNGTIQPLLDKSWWAGAEVITSQAALTQPIAPVISPSVAVSTVVSPTAIPTVVQSAQKPIITKEPVGHPASTVVSIGVSQTRPVAASERVTTATLLNALREISAPNLCFVSKTTNRLDCILAKMSELSEDAVRYDYVQLNDFEDKAICVSGAKTCQGGIFLRTP